ncbi:MAG: PUR family DNA/RNA-binding protein [Chitinophagales bacterium]|nr:PUR family DNA/RNA-binding protein [Chitinophagales bacterium]
MENEYKQRNDVHSVTLRAGKKRTYFFDVRTTKNNDYFLTITESKRVADDEGYERHKIFLYKEDFVKFVEALQETVDYVKTELLPDYDFDNPKYRDDEDTDYNNRDGE